jgi:adenosylcobinamide-GDP ribazoletransferase
VNETGRPTGRPSGFLGAVQFLTRVPVRLRSAPSLAASVPWFPVVGALIGAAIGGVAAVSMEWLPSPVAASIAVIFGVALTGAFHEDGLADTMDALGGMTPQRRREILEDSRHGSYGVAAMCSTLVLRIVCVAALGPAAAFGGLVAAHSLGRGASVAVMRTARPVPRSGLGADYARALSRSGAAVGVLTALGLAALATGWWALPLAGAAALAALLMTLLAVRAFDGVSGDILGAVEQVAECAVLVVVTGLAAHHTPWWA